ncbi:MFS transporter [Flavobacterium sp.]|uniref:MFS transporter n=1 Tax=Flavobacterium sp. TaxID=239 RepID=UPI003F6986A4
MPLINNNFYTRNSSKIKIKKPFGKLKSDYLFRVKMAVALFFFSNGFCFSSWASRIPDLKNTLHLSEADLGTILFCMPIGQLVAMPISGRLVSKIGSRTTTIYSTILYALFLIFLGLASSGWQLGLGLFFLGIIANFCNIAFNTQGVATQKLYNKPVLGFFHGSWSLAGFFGALVSLVIINFELSPFIHFIITFLIIVAIVVINSSYLVKTTSEKINEKVKKSKFQFPDKLLIWLGIIGFCCMASEGIMFDWSGVYFKEIVKAPSNLVILGYTCYMITMTTGRFLSDLLVQKYGAQKIIIASGILISIGLYVAVFFPSIIPCTLAFMMVGFGVSNVVPIVFNRAGNHATIATETALTLISSISFLGFLIGPPLIGYIAEVTNLRYSFATIGVLGVLISILTFKTQLFKTKS